MDNLSNISEIIGNLLKIDDEIKTFSEKQKILRNKRDLLEQKVLKTLGFRSEVVPKSESRFARVRVRLNAQFQF